MTFKPLYLIYAFDNFFGITTAYFKIIRLTSLISLYSLSKISQGASSAMRSEPKGKMKPLLHRPPAELPFMKAVR